MIRVTDRKTRVQRGKKEIESEHKGERNVGQAYHSSHQDI